MNNSSGDFFAGVFLTLLVAAAVGCFAVDARNKAWKKDAVKHGKAEYILNPTNGTTTWRWKD